MSIRMTLPDRIEAKLRRKAKAKRLSVEELALAILNGALEVDEAYAEPEEVVMKIQATPPNPHNIRPATGSLAEALHDAPEDSDFDLASWNRSWAVVEADLKAITRANDIAESRG